MKRVAFYNNSTFRYALFGFLFGCLFPAIGMLFSILVNHIAFGWAALIEVQRSQNLLWIIDTAPLFLGLAFGLAGKREEGLIQIKNNLEQTVTDRTSELQGLNRNLEGEITDRRKYESQLKATAEDFQLIAEVARGISMEQDINELLPLISHLVSERFGFYHVGIFLLDETRKYAVLKASNSFEGRRMLERGHRLEVGQVGMVGNVASTGRPRIASEVGQDAVYFNNPDLPETRSEIALPLIVRKQIIGVVDVQSKQADAFTQERANTLAILADQIAIAIENSRLFGEMEQALIESQAYSRQYSSQAWDQVAREQQIGYLHTSHGEEKLNQPIEWEEAKQAIKNEEIVVFSPVNGTIHESALAIPIRIREQTIGVLDIRSTDPDRLWQKEEKTIVQAVADRVGLALENARLFEETTRRADRERTVSEISTHIRSVSDPEIMLKTALEELKRVLGASEIQVHPYANPSSDQNAGFKP